MAFIGIFLVMLIFLLACIAIFVGLATAISLGLVALISGIILTAKGTEVVGKSKKKIFGITLIVVALGMIIPFGILMFKFVSMFLG
ncbi:MAG: hypothetical protein E7273_00990 [Pseudobutyrivibrio ruminis]|nr:hypothetical protein [Pseudobutyrivibrio ruminis]